MIESGHDWCSVTNTSCNQAPTPSLGDKSIFVISLPCIGVRTGVEDGWKRGINGSMPTSKLSEVRPREQILEFPSFALPLPTYVFWPLAHLALSISKSSTHFFAEPSTFNHDQPLAKSSTTFFSTVYVFAFFYDVLRLLNCPTGNFLPTWKLRFFEPDTSI